MHNLVDFLEKETGVALSWLELRKLLSTPKNSTLYCLGKINQTLVGEKLKINGKVVYSEANVELLRVTFDYKLDFDPHISNIFKKLEHT